MTEVVPDYKELHQVLRVVQKVIFRHDGIVRQFLVDDKGISFHIKTRLQRVTHA